ncbi:gamma-glutamylcyclotransferase [Aestuariivirga litoralis]|nr:gamma-glutamylcyclotransferase [Aestuariivirga litoralis]
MWRPDFNFTSARKARLHGFHRRLSVFSHHYRGTPEKPGLVLGLDRGGSCLGLVYDVAAENWAEVIAKVRAREMLGDAYHERQKRFVVLDSGESVEALTYIVQRTSKQYVPQMKMEELLHFIGQGHGTMGSCRDYVANTIQHLRELGIHDPGMEAFAPHVMN